MSKKSLKSIPVGYKQTEVGVIPEDWTIAKLGVIGKFKNGINKSADDFGFGYPFVNLMDVFGKPKIVGDEYFGLINSTDLDKKEYSLVQGDVLFIRSSVKPTGVGLTTVVMSDLMDTVYSGFLIRFRTDNQLVIEFKKHCFYEESFRNRVICASTISANTNINQDSLKDIYLVYPSSKKEQIAIANALSDVDALITELEKLIAKKQTIKTATMQQLLTGRTRLPQFALREDGSKKGTKQSELGEIPEDWEVRVISELGRVSTGGTPSTSLSELWNGDIPWITPTDISHSKNIYSSERKISQKGLQSIRRLPANSVLVTCIASIGKNAILRIDGACNQQINAVVPNENIDVDFLFYAIELSSDRLKASAGITATLIVSKALFEEFQLTVPMCPHEQTAIATILSDMDEDIQAQEKRLSKTRQIKQGMMQELLTGKTRLV